MTGAPLDHLTLLLPIFRGGSRRARLFTGSVGDEGLAAPLSRSTRALWKPGTSEAPRKIGSSSVNKARDSYPVNRSRAACREIHAFKCAREHVVRLSVPQSAATVNESTVRCAAAMGCCSQTVPSLSVCSARSTVYRFRRSSPRIMLRTAVDPNDQYKVVRDHARSSSVCCGVIAAAHFNVSPSAEQLRAAQGCALQHFFPSAQVPGHIVPVRGNECFGCYSD